MANETDQRLSELEAAFASTSAEIEGLKEAVRDAREAGRVSPLALWGPALASGLALASLAVFVLDERINPISVDVKQQGRDIREISGLLGEVKRQNTSQEERLAFYDRWLTALQDGMTENREKLNELKD